MIERNLIYIILLLIGYFIAFTVMPSFYLHHSLKDKGLGYRLCFYNIFGILYISLCSYFMAYLHIYSPLTLWGLYFILPVLIRHIIIRDKVKNNLIRFKTWYLNRNPDLVGRKMRLKIAGNYIKKFLNYFYKKYVSGRILQYVAILAILIYIIYFFGYFKTHYYTYCFTDEETHLYWISSLMNNNPFPAGLYPHGAHFISAGISSMFGLDETRIWLSFNVLSTAVAFIFGFLTVRRFFKAKGAAVFSVGFIIITNMINISSYFRLHESVPMEIGMMACFIMMYGLVDYVKTKEKTSLLLFGFGLAGTIDIHFYVAIFAAFCIVAFVIVYIIPIIKRKLLLRILICGLIAGIASVTPYAAGYVLGYQFERSIDWAVSIIENSDRDTLYGDDEETEEDTVTTEEATTENINEDNGSDYSLMQSVKDKVNKVISDLTATFTSSNLASWIFIILLVFTIAYGLIGLIICLIRKKETDQFLTYIFIGLAIAIDLMFYLLAAEGKFTIMNTVRTGTFMGIAVVLLAAMPVQVIYDIFSLLPINKKYIDETIVALSLVGLGAIYFSGNTKQLSEQYYCFDCQDADMKLCQDLVNNYEKDTWTVISPVNDMQVIRYYGYHYEIRDLLINLEEDKDIYIPTKDIFVVVETEIPDYGYGDKRMMDGSDFKEKSLPINAKQALMSLNEMGFYNLASNDRVYYDCRQGTMSKLYYWMEKIKEVYPNEVSVYSKDDKCTVYHITQDAYFLLNLNVDYTDVAAIDYVMDVAGMSGIKNSLSLNGE